VSSISDLQPQDCRANSAGDTSEVRQIELDIKSEDYDEWQEYFNQAIQDGVVSVDSSQPVIEEAKNDEEQASPRIELPSDWQKQLALGALTITVFVGSGVAISLLGAAAATSAPTMLWTVKTASVANAVSKSATAYRVTAAVCSTLGALYLALKLK